jgi:hypothetical protein
MAATTDFIVDPSPAGAGHAPPPTDGRMLDAQWVAICITEQLVRIQMSALKRRLATDAFAEVVATLSRPLWTLAAELRLEAEVHALLAESVPSAV